MLSTLRIAIDQHITEYGFSEFLVVYYGRFDPLATQCMMEAKQRHPGIRLTMLLPYHSAEHKVKLSKGFIVDSLFRRIASTTVCYGNQICQGLFALFNGRTHDGRLKRRKLDM